jgi:cytidylate kinase
LADKLGYIYIDTGAMYRAVTYLALQKGTSSDAGMELAKIAAEMDFQFVLVGAGRQIVICDGKDITEEIRDPRVSHKVSMISSHREVRQELVKKQQELANNRDVVMDGRDIGTVVLPEAECKIYLTADSDERTRRRYNELLGKGFAGSYDDIKKDIFKRDEQDKTRTVDPLRPAWDAIIVDTTGVSLEEVVVRIMKILSKS